MTRNIVVLAAFFGLAACATGPSLQSRMAAYIGSSTEDLVKGLGVPDKQIDVSGTKYLAYVQQSQEISGGYGGFGGGYGYGGFYGRGFYGGPFLYDTGFPAQIYTYGCVTTFTIKNDHVAGFTLHGNDCN